MSETIEFVNDELKFVRPTESLDKTLHNRKIDTLNHFKRIIPNIFDKKNETELLNNQANQTFFRDVSVGNIYKIARSLKPSLNNPTEDYLIVIIKNQIDEFDDELKTSIINDRFLRDMIFDIIYITKCVIIDYDFSTSLYLNKDMEVENLEEIVFSIRIPEDDFNKRIEIWDKIEDEFEKTLQGLKKTVYDPSHIKKLSRKLSIDVERR